MAHLIQNNEVFTAGTPAWHKLGVNVEKAQTWEQAAELSKCNVMIDKVQLKNPITGEYIPSYALLRADNSRFINTVGERYTPIQWQQAFDFVDTLIDSRSAHYVSAGMINGGEKLWCLAGLKKSFEPLPGDEHKTYLLFVDYRGLKSAEIKIVQTRVVCQNTLTRALSEGGISQKIRHTKSVSEKLQYAKSLIGQVEHENKTMEDKLKLLTKKILRKPDFEKITAQLFPGDKITTRKENELAIIANNFLSDKIKGAEGSAYALLQACTKFVDHQKTGFKGVESLDLSRGENALMGNGAEWKNNALDVICKVMGIGDSTPAVESTPVDSILSRMSI